MKVKKIPKKKTRTKKKNEEIMMDLKVAHYGNVIQNPIDSIEDPRFQEHVEKVRMDLRENVRQVEKIIYMLNGTISRFQCEKASAKPDAYQLQEIQSLQDTISALVAERKKWKYGSWGIKT